MMDGHWLSRLLEGGWKLSLLLSLPDPIGKIHQVRAESVDYRLTSNLNAVKTDSPRKIQLAIVW
jgi:hypothetical protein